MIQHEQSLRRKVDAYLKKLTKPRKELAGHPVCPGLAPYRHEIMVLTSETDIEGQLERIADLLYPLNIPAAIVITDLPPVDLWDITDRLLNSRTGIEIFISEPRPGKHRGVYTGFAAGTLIIIQRQDLLLESRKSAKIAGYYTDLNRTE